MIFYVVETQTGETGAVLPYAFDNRQAAEAQYHTLLAAAAVSNVPKHGVMLMNEDCFILKSEIYTHEAQPKPEPQPE